MLPNSNEKAKESFLKKKSFTLLNKTNRHIRSQSSSSSLDNEPTTIQSSFNVDTNKRGWLESTPVQVAPSRSLDTRKTNTVKPTTATIRKPVIKDVSQKDILGAVSDEDIFKLTELTSRLPEVTKSLSYKHNRSRSEHAENITRKRREQSQDIFRDDLVTSSDKILITSQQINDKKPGIRRPSFSTPSSATASSVSTTQNSSELALDVPEIGDTKRRSWLYKSLIKPYKTKSSSKSNSSKSSSSATNPDEQPQDFYNSPRLNAAANDHTKNKQIASTQFDVPNNHTRSNSSNQTAEPSAGNNTNRRHSFDSFLPPANEPDGIFTSMSKEEEDEAILNLIDNREFLDHHDDALAKWDEERKQEKSAMNGLHEERPNFNLMIASDINTDSLNNQLSESEEETEQEEEVQLMDTNIPVMMSDNSSQSSDEEVVFSFDYFSLPVEVKLLIDRYEHKGMVERKRMTIKYDDDEDYDDEEEKDDDDDDDEISKEEEEKEEKQIIQGEEDNSKGNKLDQLKEEEDEEEEDDASKEDELKEDEEEEENTIYYKDLITGNAIEGPPSSHRDTRDVAIVTVTKSDNIEFTKLIQVAMEGPSDNGPLLDLHVSLFGDTAFEIDNRTHQEEFQDTIRSIETSLSRLETFKTESQVFLRDHMDKMDSLNLYSTLPRNLSFPNLSSLMNESDPNLADEQSSASSSSSSSSSSGDNKGVVLRPIRDVLARREAYDRNAQSMYAGNTEFKSRDPFDQRQKEIISLVISLKKELYKFKSSLEKSEGLVNDVQIDMDDTRNRMETYIKDIPESHYSALKKLEVDIDSILSKRTKNPWLDTGYAILSYLLTLFALVVWIVIYILKWGKKVILFPRKLWRAYSDYLVERNKVVKKASMLSVAGGSPSTSNNNDVMFLRSNRASRREA